MDLFIVFGVFLLKDLMGKYKYVSSVVIFYFYLIIFLYYVSYLASIPNSGRNFPTEVMNIINRQSVLQHTISIAKSIFPAQITKSFMKLQSFQ
jgi:hypothetical protein